MKPNPHNVGVHSAAKTEIVGQALKDRLQCTSCCR